MAKKKSKSRLAAIERRKKLTEWSRQVRERDGWKCIVCGCPDHTQAHHLLPKLKSKAYMYCVDNGVCLCAKHHMFGSKSAEGYGLWFALWLAKYRPVQYALAVARIGVV